MIEDYETVILGLGSPHKSREAHDPYTVEERMEMIRNVYGDRVRLIPLADIGAVNPADWCEYVLKKIKGAGLPDPTAYHSGSQADALWYRDHFYAGNPADVMLGYHKDPDLWIRYLTNPHGKFCQERILHVMGRDNNPWPSATEVRQFIQLGSPHWRKYIPAVNHDLVESCYPDELRVPEARIKKIQSIS
jgi:hypothetical protein